MKDQIDTSAYNWLPLQPWQLPNEKDILSIKVNSNTYFITKFNNQFYAGKSKCPHANGNLTQGHINDKGEIVCPLHCFTFSLKDGKETSDHGSFYLNINPVKQATDGVFYMGLPKKGWLDF